MSGSRLGRPARMGKPDFGMFSVFLYSIMRLLLSLYSVYQQNKKRPCLPKRQRRNNLCGTTLVAGCTAAGRPHQPWAREGNGPPPSVPTVVSAGSSGVIFAACLVSAFHQTAALLARKQALLIPIIADMLYKRYFTRTFAVCQPEKASKSPQSANNFCVFCQRGRGRGARNS